MSEWKEFRIKDICEAIKWKQEDMKDKIIKLPVASIDEPEAVHGRFYETDNE